MAKKEKEPSDFGKKIADLLGKFSESIAEESGAKAVLVTAKFQYVYEGNKGHLILDVNVSPDARKEKLDGTLKPRGNKLQSDGEETIQQIARQVKWRKK